ncbi:MAG: DUF3043 domain-containing protein [Nocardioidaceae bacterium]
MFRRTKSDDRAATATLTKEGGKGRPTPSRKNAQAAARARAKVPRNRKEANRQMRARRADATGKARQALRTGDERYLPTRDKGPVRHFVRDFVDSRLCVAEMLLPLLVLIMITTAFDQKLANGLWSGTIVLVGLDSALLVFRLRRELRKRFTDQSTRGTTLYALMRSMQLRWLRLPKMRVKLGAKLPARY